MAAVTNELMFEVLRSMQARFDRIDASLGEVRQEIVSIRLTALGTQSDIHNIFGVTARIEERLDRMEHRLELRELAEPQHPCEPK